MAGIGAVRRVAEERALGAAIRQCIGLPHVHMRFIYSLREAWSRRPGYTTPDSRPWSRTVRTKTNSEKPSPRSKFGDPLVRSNARDARVDGIENTSSSWIATRSQGNGRRGRGRERETERRRDGETERERDGCGRWRRRRTRGRERE